MDYAPPRRDPRKKPMMIVVLCIAIVCITLGIFMMMNQEESVIERYRVCGLSEEETIARLHQESNETFTIRD